MVIPDIGNECPNGTTLNRSRQRRPPSDSMVERPNAHIAAIPATHRINSGENLEDILIRAGRSRIIVVWWTWHYLLDKCLGVRLQGGGFVHKRRVMIRFRVLVRHRCFAL